MLDRRISVAPMMDWTDRAEFAHDNNGLRAMENRRSFLVAPDIVICMFPNMAAGDVCAGRIPSCIECRIASQTVQAWW
jgi:hypothetical protein